MKNLRYHVRYFNDKDVQQYDSCLEKESEVLDNIRNSINWCMDVGKNAKFQIIDVNEDKKTIEEKLLAEIIVKIFPQ